MAYCLPSYNCCSHNWMTPCCLPAMPPPTDDWMWKSRKELYGTDEFNQLKQNTIQHDCEEVKLCVHPKHRCKCKKQYQKPACYSTGRLPVIKSRRIKVPFVEFKDCEEFVFLDGKYTLYTQPPKEVSPQTKCPDPSKNDPKVYTEYQELEINPKEQEYDWYIKHSVGPVTVYTPVDINNLPKKTICPDNDVFRTEHYLLIRRPKGVSPTTFQRMLEPNLRSTTKLVPAL